MKICRFDDDQVGVVEDGRVFDVTARVPSGNLGAAAGEAWFSVHSVVRALPPEAVRLCRSYPLEEVRLRSPVRTPGKIIAAPVNYAAHVREMVAAGLLPPDGRDQIRDAGLFLKASSSLVGPADGVTQRFPARRTDYEVELVAVIGRRADGVPAERALEFVAGYCVGLDITLRGSEDRSFRKSIDSYSVLGPWLTTADEVPGPQALRLSLWQNGLLRQDTSTGDMVLNVADLIAYASSFYTLYPGDLLYTGSPAGVGPIQPGDVLRAECSSLGAMNVTVSGW